MFFITHDLEEAIFLGDKVVAHHVAARRIRQVVPVSLEKPRRHTVLTSPEFLAIKATLSGAIHEEARRAFVYGERELA